MQKHEFSGPDRPGKQEHGHHEGEETTRDGHDEIVQVGWRYQLDQGGIYCQDQREDEYPEKIHRVNVTWKPASKEGKCKQAQAKCA